MKANRNPRQRETHKTPFLILSSMFKDIIGEIIEKNESVPSEPAPSGFSSPNPAPTNSPSESEPAFETITPSPLSTCFVDGGNACVFDSPAVRVEYVRVYGTVHDGRERTTTRKEEGLVLVRNDGKGKIRVKGYAPLALELSLPENHPELSLGKESVSLGSVAALCRFILECRFLAAFGKDCDLVVRDGSLVGKNAFEEEELQKLLNSKELVAGLCKMNTLLTNGMSATASAFEQGPQGPWLTPYGKEAMVDIAIVKLDARSKYAFRLDVQGKVHDAMQRVAAALSLVSSDAAFPGYPYPLIEADQLGRVSNKELDLLRTRFMMEAGQDWKALERMARGSDAHDVLDRL